MTFKENQDAYRKEAAYNAFIRKFWNHSQWKELDASILAYKNCRNIAEGYNIQKQKPERALEELRKYVLAALSRLGAAGKITKLIMVNIQARMKMGIYLIQVDAIIEEMLELQNCKQM
jgi:hypothetical protein